MSEKFSIKRNRKDIANIVLNLSSIVILNAVIQFAIYPFLNKKLGENAYGVALSILAVISVVSVAFGTSANYSRVINQQTLNPSNGDYNVFLVFGAVVSIIVCTVFLFVIKLATFFNVLFIGILSVVTMLRYYSDVEFRYKKNFLRYFIFYVAISVGYLIGLLVFKLTNLWMTALICGELSGIIFVIFASSIYKQPFKTSSAFKHVFLSATLLFLSTLFENLTLNADRILLLLFENGTTVSIYYTASLLGKVVALLSVPVNSLAISYLIHYKKPLTKKFWLAAVGISLVVTIVGFGCCFGGAHILIPILYENLYEASAAYFAPALLSQVFYFVSSVLLVILLRFFGEKKQFYFNLVYGIVFFIMTIVGTAKFGLNGFIYFSLAANALRLIVIMIWGFIPQKQLSVESDDEKTENADNLNDKI